MSYDVPQVGVSLHGAQVLMDNQNQICFDEENNITSSGIIQTEAQVRIESIASTREQNLDLNDQNLNEIVDEEIAQSGMDIETKIVLQKTLNDWNAKIDTMMRDKDVKLMDLAANQPDGKKK